MAANYGVIAWKMQGGESLNPEEIEVCKLSKLIIKDATIPRPGVTVNLQFMQTLWEGTILSIHGKKKDGEKALTEAVTPRPSSTMDGGRSRKKKSFGDDFVNEDNLAPEVTDNGRKASGGKKRPDASAANKEKQKEKERKREERQQHRNVLAEQNTLLLSRMVDVENSEVDENFDDDLVQDCVEILQSHPSGASSTTNPNSTPRQPPTSINTPIQNQQQRQHLQSTPHSSQPVYTITPLQSVQRQPLQSITVSPHEMPLNSRQPKPLATPHFQDEARPKFGGKCPRRRQLSNELQEESDGCSSCKRLKQEVQDLRRQLDAYEGQNDQARPKPGKVHPAIANRFKMIEMSPGSGIFVFDSQIEQALARKSPTSCAAFLLNCFYTNTEMAGMNLTGANGKPHPDKQIIDSIIAFTMKKHNSSAAVIKASLRNKFTANTSRAKKHD